MTDDDPSPASAAGAIAWYGDNARRLSSSYEALDPATLHRWLADLLPPEPGLVIDIGAGTGRDAAWLAGLGHEVIAAEPSAEMRALGARLHPHPRITWVDDRLPSLSRLFRLGTPADAVLLAAVWQHVAPDDRPAASRKVASLLRPGGLLAVTLRDGPSEAGRGMHPVSADELEVLARSAGLMVVRVVPAQDALGRPDVSWTNVAMRLPDDGTGALPLLRHILLDDQKSSTYKLGLLRALCRAADAAGGLASDAGDGHVAVPLGVVALNWLRLYLPLVRAGLPQGPANRGTDGLGFARTGFRAILAGAASHLDLRAGATFGKDAAAAVDTALGDAADTVIRMPATYLTHPDGSPIFPVSRGRRRKPQGGLALDRAYLGSFSEMRVPGELWQAMQRFAAWIEPALCVEWVRLMKGYAFRQGAPFDEARAWAAMAWSDPARVVAASRTIAVRLIDTGHEVRCVWSGRRLDVPSLDIDHCLPWSAWPCGELWNLMPTNRTVNQRQKRDLLPSSGLLASAGQASGSGGRPPISAGTPR